MSAPAFIRPALSFLASLLSSRFPTVIGSFSDLASEWTETQHKHKRAREGQRCDSLVINSGLSLSVGEGHLGRDDRLEEPDVDDLGLGGHFLEKQMNTR